MAAMQMCTMDGVPITADCAVCGHTVADHDVLLPAPKVGYARCSKCDCGGYADD